MEQTGPAAVDALLSAFVEEDDPLGKMVEALALYGPPDQLLGAALRGSSADQAHSHADGDVPLLFAQTDVARDMTGEVVVGGTPFLPGRPELMITRHYHGTVSRLTWQGKGLWLATCAAGLAAAWYDEELGQNSRHAIDFLLGVAAPLGSDPNFPIPLPGPV